MSYERVAHEKFMRRTETLGRDYDGANDPRDLIDEVAETLSRNSANWGSGSGKRSVKNPGLGGFDIGYQIAVTPTRSQPEPICN